MQLPYAYVKYPELKLRYTDGEKVRGYFADKYTGIQEMHNHEGSACIYQYPKVQYKIIDGSPVIVGLNECSDLIANISLLESDIVIDNRFYDLGKADIVTDVCSFGITETIQNYEFLTPWFALNQENVQKYDKADEIEKEELLERILIGNLISMSKSFGYTVEDRIRVKLNLERTATIFKSKKMVAFEGSFKVNFNIPDYTGIGKSVSRGFGSVRLIRK